MAIDKPDKSNVPSGNGNRQDFFDFQRELTVASIARAEEQLGIKLKHIPMNSASRQIRLALKPRRIRDRRIKIPDDDTLMTNMLKGTSICKDQAKSDSPSLTANDILDTETALNVELRYHTILNATNIIRLLYHRAADNGEVHEQLRSLAKAGKLNRKRNTAQKLQNPNRIRLPFLSSNEQQEVAELMNGGPKPSTKIMCPVQFKLAEMPNRGPEGPTRQRDTGAALNKRKCRTAQRVAQLQSSSRKGAKKKAQQQSHSGLAGPSQTQLKMETDVNMPDLRNNNAYSAPPSARMDFQTA